LDVRAAIAYAPRIKAVLQIPRCGGRAVFPRRTGGDTSRAELVPVSLKNRAVTPAFREFSELISVDERIFADALAKRATPHQCVYRWV
jgi:hypothetical protein